MNTHNKTIGMLGENLAVDYLAKKGYIILERNVRTPFGEIDIIAQDGRAVVFIEVKTRSTAKNGLGREAITKTKKAHMLSSADYYCSVHSLEDQLIRIDVIELTLDTMSIVHFQDALL